MTLLTATEVADKLQVDESWVYRHKDEIGYVRLGPRLIRFFEQTVLAYIEGLAA
jgi:excisionase family DNA binding protein